MSELVQVLIEAGYEFHTRSKGASGCCWHIGSRRTASDHQERQARSFLALSKDASGIREINFRFYVTRTAVATAAAKERIGDLETFLRDGGLSRFKKLLHQDDTVEGSYPEVGLHSRSAPTEYVAADEQDLDAEISRVRIEVLKILRSNTYRGIRRTAKADIVHAICTSDVILDRILIAFEKSKYIGGVMRGEIQLMPEGEAYYESIAPSVMRGGSAAMKNVTISGSAQYDVFISHASEDKEKFVRPLAERLVSEGVKVWYDEFSLTLGDSLRESIDKGLAASRYGVVILSNHFFAKDWPKRELNGLFALMEPGKKKLLPIWHEITREELARHSPIVVDLLAARSSDGVPAVVAKILEVVRGHS